MKYLPLFLLSSVSLFGQEVFSEKTDSTVNFYARNSYHCHYTVTVSIETLENMKSSAPLPARFVLEPLATRQFLMSIAPDRSPGIRSWRYKFQYQFDQGNRVDARHNDAYSYLLPYSSTRPHKLVQGYFGKFSHAEVHALDFEMPEGTEIVAAREGVVVEIKEDSNVGGTTRDYLDKGNFVIVYHDDGTFGNYFHLKQQGALVSAGQRVERGTVIGLSGNTGLSSAPHLHFEVLLPSAGGKQTVPTRFNLRDGSVETLQEGRSY